MGERNDLIEQLKATREIWKSGGSAYADFLLPVIDKMEDDAATIASLSEALAEAEKKGAEAYEALTAAQSRLTAIFAIETHSLHVGYDEGSGGGNFVYADVIRTDDPAFVAARDLSQGGQHG